MLSLDGLLVIKQLTAKGIVFIEQCLAFFEALLR
jgi:hypothetical protein